MQRGKVRHFSLRKGGNREARREKEQQFEEKTVERKTGRLGDPRQFSRAESEDLDGNGMEGSISDAGRPRGGGKAKKTCGWSHPNATDTRRRVTWGRKG